MHKPGRGNRKRGSKKGRGIIRTIMVLVITGYLVWVSFNYIGSILKASLIQTELASYGEIKSTLPFEGILIRKETLLSAPARGKVEPLVKEGERVRVGANVISVHAPDVNSKDGVKRLAASTPVAGIASFYIDGLEGDLKPENLSNIKISEVLGKKLPEGIKYIPGKEVQGGERIAKVVNNLSPMYILTHIPKKQVLLKKLKDADSIKVELESPEHRTLFLKLYEMSPEADKIRMVLEFNNYEPLYINNRIHRFSIITESYEGYIIPKEAVVYKEKKPGVYIVYKNSTRWRPIKIEGEIGAQLAVSGLEVDTTYVRNPQYAREGQPID